MIGQYTNDEMLSMNGIISDVKTMYRGKIVRKMGSTYNYYYKHSDGSWTNYDCKTVPTVKYNGGLGSHPVIGRYI